MPDVSQIEVLPHRSALRLGEVEVHLARNDLFIAEALAVAAGRILSKGDLLDASDPHLARESEAYSAPSAIKRIRGSLRKTLGPGAGAVIRTHYGLGYSWHGKQLARRVEVEERFVLPCPHCGGALRLTE